jgi:bacteriorhodopsin
VNDLMPLSSTEYLLVMNVLNLSVALFGGFSLLFMLLRRNVGHTYSIGVSLMAAVTAMAAYHYVRIYGSWLAAYQLQGGQYLPTGAPFSYGYRYADWIGTVPLLLSAIMLVLDLGRQKSASLVSRMVVSAVLMIGLGAIGESQHVNMLARLLWGAAATLPFIYILYVLWHEVNQVLAFESGRVQQLFSRLRLVLLVSWLIYPALYLLPVLGLGNATGLTLIQLSNSAADLLAKIGIGLLIFSIAREKTEEDRAISRSDATVLVPAD